MPEELLSFAVQKLWDLLSQEFFFPQGKRCFLLFAGKPNTVNSPSQHESNPGGGSYSRNPFTTGPTRRRYHHVYCSGTNYRGHNFCLLINII